MPLSDKSFSSCIQSETQSEHPLLADSNFQELIEIWHQRGALEIMGSFDPAIRWCLLHVQLFFLNSEHLCARLWLVISKQAGLNGTLNDCVMAKHARTG